MLQGAPQPEVEMMPQGQNQTELHRPRDGSCASFLNTVTDGANRLYVPTSGKFFKSPRRHRGNFEVKFSR
jgi:hypothetical protein